MDASESFLTSSKYGYSFVVAMTQLSTNAALEEYLRETTQPENFYCYVQVRATPETPRRKSLTCLGSKYGPRRTPNVEPHRDARPPRQDGPYQLPPILQLGSDASSITFRMFCSDLQVVQLDTDGTQDGVVSWNVWAQPRGRPCYLGVVVDLTNDHLPSQLDSDYFDKYPDVKTRQQTQLGNLSDTAFSLQQLLSDLDSAVLQTFPSFENVPLGVQTVLTQFFVPLWSVSGKKYGLPLLSMVAVPQGKPDVSQIQITSFERYVGPHKDANGNVMQNPTAEQKNMTTMNHLCMTGNLSQPPAVDFPWNWVGTQDAGSQGGVIAINRQVFFDYLLNSIFLPQVRRFCSTTTVQVQTFNTPGTVGKFDSTTTFSNNQTPQTAEVSSTNTGAPLVIDIAYTANNDHGVSGMDSLPGFSCALKVVPNYKCILSVAASTLDVTQRLWVVLDLQWDLDDFMIDDGMIGTSAYQDPTFTGYDVTLTDTYDMSVGQDGQLQIIRDPGKQVNKDDSASPDSSLLQAPLKALNYAVAQIKKDIAPLQPVDMTGVAIPATQNFVFPGAKVATYSSATFSNYQELVCDITYVNPEQAPSAQVCTCKQSW